MDDAPSKAGVMGWGIGSRGCLTTKRGHRASSDAPNAPYMARSSVPAHGHQLSSSCPFPES